MLDQVHIPRLLLAHLHMHWVEAKQREGGQILFPQRDVSSGFPNMGMAGSG